MEPNETHTYIKHWNPGRMNMKKPGSHFVSQYLSDEQYLKIITDADVRVVNEKIKLSYNKRSETLRSLEGKTVHITALNIDIVNSTKQVKALLGEQEAEYYSRFIESTSDLIQKYGGYVLKNVGDSVIGFFLSGGCVVENHDRAMLCGVAMLDMVRHSLNPYFVEKKMPAIECRVSADFGRTKVCKVRALGGYSETDMFGTALNSVAKISHYGKPGQMVIGDNLFWQLVDSDVLDSDLGLELKMLKRWDLTGKYTYPVYLVKQIEQASTLLQFKTKPDRLIR